MQKMAKIITVSVPAHVILLDTDPVGWSKKGYEEDSDPYPIVHQKNGKFFRKRQLGMFNRRRFNADLDSDLNLGKNIVADLDLDLESAKILMRIRIHIPDY